MNLNISADLYRLKQLLPLKDRQDALDSVLQDIHRHILQSFATTGRPVSRTQLADQSGGEKIDEILKRLASDDLIVISR